MYQYVYVDESHKEYVMIHSYLSCQLYIPQWQQTTETNYSVTYCEMFTYNSNDALY